MQLGRTRRRFVQSLCFGEREVLDSSVKGTLVGGVLGWEGDVPSVGLIYRSKPGEVKKLRVSGPLFACMVQPGGDGDALRQMGSFVSSSDGLIFLFFNS